MQYKLILILLVTITLVSCKLIGVKGNGDLIKESRDIDNFNNIDISGNFDIEIDAGGKLKLEVIAESNLMKLIKTKVKRNTLYIYSKNNLRPKKELRIVIAVPELFGIDCSGSNDIVAMGINSDEFEIDLSGASSIEIAGITDYLEIDVSGAADLQAKKLITKDVSIDVSGAANAEIYALKSCKAEVSGAGFIELYGDAIEVYTDISGAAGLERK